MNQETIKPVIHSNELDAISRTVQKYQEDPQALRRAMVKAGIITNDGQLTEQYQKTKQGNSQ